MSKRVWYMVKPWATPYGEVLESLCTAVASDVAASFQMDEGHVRMFVFTDIAWDTLREQLPNAVVSIAEDMMRAEAANIQEGE